MNRKILTAFLSLWMIISLLPGTSITANAAVWDPSTPDTDFAGGDGLTADTAFEIGTAEQLALMADKVNNHNSTVISGSITFGNAYYKLTADIELNDVDDLEEWGTAAPANTWTPIGSESAEFAGTFDGNNHTVSGIYTNSGHYKGLFGYLNSGTLKNVGIVDSYISGGGYIGSIVGYYNSGTVTNCYNTGSISGSGNVGGIAGWNINGQVSYCHNTGVIKNSTGNTGGIVGGSYGDSGTSTVSYCYNSGAIMSTFDNTGGIVGYSYIHYSHGGSAAVSHSYNIGKITGDLHVGGIVGYSDGNVGGSPLTVTNCYNTGMIAGHTGVGGIAGYYEITNLSNCYNAGNISGVSQLGSIAGLNTYLGLGTISDCYYDKQMCPLGGINGEDISGQTEGRSTANMTGSNLSSGLGDASGWTFADALYPRLADNGATWQSGNIFSGLSANTAYSIVGRVAASGSDLASDAGPALSVTTYFPVDDTPVRTITVTETSSPLFSDAQGAIRAEANMAGAFFDSVEVKVTDTDESAANFSLGFGNTVYPFDISLYIRGTNTKTEPRDGYAVTISLPVPDEMLDVKERLFVIHKDDNGSVTTLSSQLKQINGVWYLVFEATDFSPYALVVSNAGTYDETVGLPYYMDSNGEEVFIGFAASGKYIAPSGVTVLVKENPKSFSDIGSHWAKDSIEFVTEREIFLGTGNGAFSPDSGMTRAMFASVIGRLYERSYGEIETGSSHAFTDCEYDDYYGKYVDWAAENGILDGYGNCNFGPDDLVTREQMAAILYRFADFLGVLPDEMDTALSYPDADSISGYAESAALYCQSPGFITGRDGGIFAPQETATRAEVATIIQGFVEIVLG